MYPVFKKDLPLKGFMAPPQGKIHYMREILYLLETILKRETKIILAILCQIKGKKAQV